jgi:hypothetical protein
VLDEQLNELLPIYQADGHLPGARILHTGTRTEVAGSDDEPLLVGTQ